MIEAFGNFFAAFTPACLAGVIAAIVTYCDLHNVFDTPPSLTGPPKRELLGLWWGFVAVNGILAMGLYGLLREADLLSKLGIWGGATVTGIMYPALVRLKFITLPIKGQDTPIGMEALYEGVKGLIHKRINRIIGTWRRSESNRLVNQHTIAEMRQQCREKVNSDVLMTEQDRESSLVWIDLIIATEGMDEAERKFLLALFMISDQKRSPAPANRPPNPQTPSPARDTSSA